MALPIIVTAYSGHKPNELCSEYDGAELMSRPSIKLIPVDADVVHKAERLMESCEKCHPGDADIPLHWLLAEVTGKQAWEV